MRNIFANHIFANIFAGPSRAHSFTTAHLMCMPIPGVKCPCCLAKGETVWVIPGKNCPKCNTPCGRNSSILIGMILAIVGILLLGVTISDQFVSNYSADHLMLSFFGLVTTKFSHYFGTPSKPHHFTTTQLKCMPFAGVECPCCGAKGDTVWVIPGKKCPRCDTQCRTPGVSLPIILTCIVLVGIVISVYSSDMVTVMYQVFYNSQK